MRQRNPVAPLSYPTCRFRERTGHDRQRPIHRYEMEPGACTACMHACMQLPPASSSCTYARNIWKPQGQSQGCPQLERLQKRLHAHAHDGDDDHLCQWSPGRKGRDLVYHITLITIICSQSARRLITARCMCSCCTDLRTRHAHKWHHYYRTPPWTPLAWHMHMPMNAQ